MPHYNENKSVIHHTVFKRNNPISDYCYDLGLPDIYQHYTVAVGRIERRLHAEWRKVMAQEKKKTSPNVSGSAYYSIRNKNRVEQKKVLSRWNGAGSVMQTSVLSNNKS